MEASFGDGTLEAIYLQMIAAGFAVGFLVGLTGVGAGALMTPLLITGFNVPPSIAVGTDLLFASITKASAAFRHHKSGNVHWPILKWLALGSLPAALLVLAWLYFSKADTNALAIVIRALLAVALVASAIIIPLCPVLLSGSERASATDGEIEARRFGTLAFGAVVGILVTLTSVGAGAIGVAVLSLLYPALLARRIVGTDIVHAIPLAFVSGAGHLGLGNVDWVILGTLLVGSIPGIALGTRLTGVLPDWLLRLVLSVVLLYAAYLLTPALWSLLGGAAT